MISLSIKVSQLSTPMKVILNANQASLPPNINPLQPRKVHQFQVSMLPPSPDPPTKDQLLCYTWSHCLEEPGWLQTMESPRVGHNWATSLSHTGVGNGNTLQCSCLENPRDGGAWWAAVYGVAQSRTGLSSSSSYLVYFPLHDT